MPLSPNVPGIDTPAGPVTGIAGGSPKPPRLYGSRRWSGERVGEVGGAARQRHVVGERGRRADSDVRHFGAVTSVVDVDMAAGAAGDEQQFAGLVDPHAEGGPVLGVDESSPSPS